MSKHTEGPWEWNGKDQLVATTVMTQPYFDDEKTEPVVIIETDGGYYPPRGYDRLLLAAAPDLLTALNDLLVGMEASGGWPGDDGLFDAGMAAYKKATGVE